jgi:hypothetical protein
LENYGGKYLEGKFKQAKGILRGRDVSNPPNEFISTCWYRRLGLQFSVLPPLICGLSHKTMHNKGIEANYTAEYSSPKIFLIFSDVF